MRVRAFALSVGVTASCGRYAFDEQAQRDSHSIADAGATADGAFSDAATGPRRDANQAPPRICSGWSTPEPLATLNTAGNERASQISSDGLVLIWKSGATPLVATRPSRTSDFTAPTPLLGFESTSVFDVALAPSGREVYFSTNDSCVQVATSATALDFRGAPRHEVEALCAPRGGLAATGPHLTPDGLTMVIATSTNSGFGTLHFATRASTAVDFSAPQPVAELGNAAGFPAVSSDGNTLFFEQPAPRLQLWTATRLDAARPFSTPAALSFTNGVAQYEDASITADATELYFDTDRDGSGGNWDLFRVTRTCL